MTAAAAGGERLNRYLARHLAAASRRGADDLISSGRVLLNGRPAQLGDRVGDGDEVRVDGAAVGTEPERRVLILNKPAGVVSTARDPQRRVTILDLVADPTGLHPVGRLDADSRGLLLLSSDGELTYRLTHPRHGIVRTYRVTLDRPLGAAALARLRDGLELEDGWARPLAVRGAAGGITFEIDMGEGRRREVRRLFAAAGATVTDLERIAYGPLRLGRLAEGATRRPDAAELEALYAAVGLPVPQR